MERRGQFRIGITVVARRLMETDCIWYLGVLYLVFEECIWFLINGTEKEDNSES